MKRYVSLYVPHAPPLGPLCLSPTGLCEQIAVQHFVSMCPPLAKPAVFDLRRNGDGIDIHKVKLSDCLLFLQARNERRDGSECLVSSFELEVMGE